MNHRTAIRVGALTGLLACATAAPALAQPRGGYPPPYGLPYGPISADSSLRIAVEPRTASVYVDGYFAGLVDEFDGIFQRLHVTPGRHEIVIHLEGYRSLRQQLYLSPNVTRKIAGTLEPLRPGEPGEPAPRPADVVESRVAPGPRAPRTRPGMPLPPPDANPDARDERPAGPTRATLAIQVQPADADVVVDGQHWTGPGQDTRLLVQVADGRHVVEVHKRGYRGYVTEVEARRGDTVPLNVSLTPEP